MNEITDEQRAAWQRLNPSHSNGYLDGVHNRFADIRLIASLLPDALTNPQPVLPTEPGWYLATNQQSPSGKVAIELLRTGEWVDNTDSHYLQLSWVADHGPLTRLVPERPQVTKAAIEDAYVAQGLSGVFDLVGAVDA